MHLIMNEWMNGNFQTAFQLIVSKPASWKAIEIDKIYKPVWNAKIQFSLSLPYAIDLKCSKSQIY